MELVPELQTQVLYLFITQTVHTLQHDRASTGSLPKGESLVANSILLPSNLAPAQSQRYTYVPMVEALYQKSWPSKESKRM
jgi:hypothetical protein